MRAKRMLVRSGIIACGVILFGLLFRGSHLLLARRSSVSGEREQNGWTFVRRYSGETRPEEKPNAIAAFVQRLFGQTQEQSPSYWPQYPALMLQVPIKDVTPDGDMEHMGVSAQAVSSTGDRFSLGLENLSSTCYYAQESQDSGRDVYARLPPVPTTYKWLDMTLIDKKGNQATWRVYNLPQMIHNNLGPVQTGPLNPIPGITLEARAYWSPEGKKTDSYEWDKSVAGWASIKTEIRMQNLTYSDMSLRWLLDDPKMQ